MLPQKFSMATTWRGAREEPDALPPAGLSDEPADVEQAVAVAAATARRAAAAKGRIEVLTYVRLCENGFHSQGVRQ
jgi:hypothetical protein